ncbi:aminopeptidase [Paenibacillus gallinarum]|uniref:Aminopeptidase n=1 Tax=Paenibacillus gallinarum TaxID=2762232 RepID=A0ABR8SY42_9BACL|nr:aminopeptidase [Paenibacillus gallinarum]MBD7968254.1 aminopeptidase [Paenibacillus gallinarum]
MSDFAQKLKAYAELTIKVGVNIQPGQALIVHAPVEAREFVRLIVKEAYDTGASFIKVQWNDEQITRMQYDLASDEIFEKEPKWYAGEMTEMVEEGAAVLHILSENPDLLKGVNQNRIVAAQKARGKAMAKYRAYQQADKFSWCLIAVPSPEWAAKVFPDAPEQEQVSLLWEAIFKTVRIGEADPVAAWQKHITTLENKSKVLNEKKYKKLHYIAPGTDLTIELPEGHLWAQGDSINEKGHTFVANMPTEEVFTAPLKTGVNGTVSSTKPLSYGGNLIDKFSLTFENGRIIKVTAEEGLEALQNLVDIDEGSHYLGEVALVPHQSPISDTNILFYNTLFDENASNHLAIGSAYAFNLEGGKNMNQEQLAAAGLNTSLTHVDFMIGSAEMDIYGITADGTKEPIFLKGNWAF